MPEEGHLLVVAASAVGVDAGSREEGSVGYAMPDAPRPTPRVLLNDFNTVPTEDIFSRGRHDLDLGVVKRPDR